MTTAGIDHQQQQPAVSGPLEDVKELVSSVSVTTAMQPHSPPLRNTTRNPDSIQGRRENESRMDYLHRVLDRVAELGERKPAAKKMTTCNDHDANYLLVDGSQEAPPPPPPSYDEALALGLFLDEKLALNDSTPEGSTTSFAASDSYDHISAGPGRRRRSRPLHLTASAQMSSTSQAQDDHHFPQPRRRRPARNGSLLDQAHSLTSEESVRAEMERIQRELAVDDDEDGTTNTSTIRSKDHVFQYPPALEPLTQQPSSEEPGSLQLVTRRGNLPSLKDAQRRPYVG